VQEERAQTSPADSQEGDAPGDAIRVFRAKVTTRLVVVACGIVLLGAGVWLLIEMSAWGPGPWLLTLGIVVLWLAYLMGRSSYLVYRDRVVKKRLGHEQICWWNEVSEVLDLRVKQGIVSSRTCVLVKTAGTRFELQDLGINAFAAMLDLLRQQAASRGIPWREERVVK
jgi:hypothetical protein